MDTEDYVLLGAAAVALYLAYKFYRGINPIANNPQDVRTWLQNSNTGTVINQGKDTVLQVKSMRGTTNYYFSVDDFNKLNAAQKVLLSLDKVVPGTWLTRAVLE